MSSNVYGLLTQSGGQGLTIRGWLSTWQGRFLYV